MENKVLLTFSLHGLLYGIDAVLVQEIFYLPELTPIIEAADDIVGLLNLRGKLLPVMHLAVRLEQHLPECSLSDSVIVLAWEGLQIGIIVNSVNEVKNISPEWIESNISYRREKGINSTFIAGFAKVDADMIMLLEAKKLFCHSEEIDTLEIEKAPDDLSAQYEKNQLSPNSKTQKKSKLVTNFYARCCPNATLAEKAIFRSRSENLRQSTESSDFHGLIPIAVIGLNGEYFGLDLEVVREFTNLRNVTPIPCCPPHVIGNMNLRGEIVTLVDIRTVLQMPIAASTFDKAIVIQFDDVVAGLPVDEVFDVMYLNPLDVRNIPTAINSGSDELLRGTAFYSEKMLSILDLPRIISKGSLAVSEEV